jgi:hypothetical protein
VPEWFICCVLLRLRLLVGTAGIGDIDYKVGSWNTKDLEIRVSDDEFHQWNSRCATIVVGLGGERPPHSRAENGWILAP